MKRPAFLIAALLALPACDNTSEDIEVLPRAADDEAPDDEATPPHGPHGKRHHGRHGEGRMVERLCAAVECTQQQQQQLAALRPDRPRDGDPGEREAHFDALAELVRADVFDTAALAEMQASHEHRHEARRAEMAAAVVAAHGILTAEQRSIAADKIETLVPMMLGKHGGEGRKHDPAKKADKKAARLCEQIACTADQVTAVAAAFASAMPKPDPAARSKATAAAAEALRADSIDAATAGALLDQLDDVRPRRHAELTELLPAVHAALGQQQREALADLIAREGPRALTGGKHGRHGKHGKRGRHRERKNPGEAEQLAG